MGEVDRAITSYFATQEQHLLLEDLGKASAERLRSILRKEATFEQILVLDPDGTLIFPNPDQPLSRREADYLVKIEQLLTDRNLTRLAAGESSILSNVPAMNQAVRQQTRSLGSKFLKPATSNEEQQESSTSAERGYGWYTWYWGQGLQVLHWRRLDNGGVLAVGLQRARWMADIIAILPDSTLEGDVSDTSPAQIRLVNAGSRTVYQWGTKTFSKDEPPQAT